MTSKLLLGAVMGLAAIHLGCDDFDIGGERREAPFHYSFDMRPGARLEVEGFNGSVEIQSWDQNKADISGAKYGNSDAALDAIRIDARQTPDGVMVRAVRASGFRGNLGTKFVIQVPRNTRLDRIVTSNGGIRIENTEGPVVARTSNGGVRLAGVHGDVDVTTSNGGVDVDGATGRAVLNTSNAHIQVARLSGPVHAQTSNGSVTLEFDSTPKDDVRADTSNASITIRMPGDAAVRLRASTSNASINTDFDVTARGEISKTRLEGTINGSGPLMELTTSNGGIHIERR